MRLPLAALPLLLACDPRTPGKGEVVDLLGFTPSNVVLPDDAFEGVGDVVLDDDDGCTIGAIATGRLNCGADLADYRIHELVDAQGAPLVVVTLGSLTVSEATAAAVEGDAPLAIVALDFIDVQGALRVSPGELGGAPGSGSDPEGAGEGAGRPSAASNQNGSGGTYCGRGGASGDGTASAEPYGGVFLVPLAGGSSGGGRFSGAGGGALQLTAGSRVTVSGSLSAPGEGDGIDAGGGAGGGLLLEAAAIEVTGVIAANGGGGASEDKVDAEDGLASAEPAAGGVSDEDGASGGAGSAGARVDGEAGTPPTDEGRGGGSGGGGAGRLRFNVLDGAFVSDGATLSPGLDTLCAVVGELTPPGE